MSKSALNLVTEATEALADLKQRLEAGDLAKFSPEIQLMVIRGFLLNLGGYEQ